MSVSSDKGDEGRGQEPPLPPPAPPPLLFPPPPPPPPPAEDDMECMLYNIIIYFSCLGGREGGILL